MQRTDTTPRTPSFAGLFQPGAFLDPAPIRWLLGSPQASVLWLLLRLYLGWQWLSAGIEKVNSPAWTRTGAALQAFLTASTKGVPGQKGAAIHYGWYHDVLTYMLDHQWYTWFGKVIAFGETTVGIALIVGAFVGIAAFFGAVMNFNYLLAGTASTNPVLFLLAMLLLLAWKVAGYLGADFTLLPLFGTPWQPGYVPAAVAHPARAPGRAGRRLGEALMMLAAFAAAGVVAVLAANRWASTRPWLGYAVSLAAVLVAWLLLAAVSLLLQRQASEERAIPAATMDSSAHPEQPTAAEMEERQRRLAEPEGPRPAVDERSRQDVQPRS
jgi:thiosulfate dehydrogenase (quinone) large subunit